MSSAYVVLGVGVTKTTFFVTQDSGIQCPQGHRPKEGSGTFCGRCGGRFGPASVEVPTPDFDAWSKRLGHPADEVWEMLNEYDGGIPVSSSVKMPKKLINLYGELTIHQASGIESAEHPGTSLVLGFRILDQDGEGNRHTENSCTLADLRERSEFLETVVKELKITFLLPISLYLSFYWS